MHLRVHRRAFTLIELLVVIAIIAILAAILFPVFAQAKAAAKTSVCLNGVKQDGMAHVMYAGDYDDSMMFQPVWWYSATYDGAEGGTWWWGWVNFTTRKVDPTRGTLSPYTKSGDILDCPTAKSITQSFPWSGGGGLPTLGVGVNPQILSTGNGTVRSYTGIELPAETILFGDAARWDQTSRVYYRTDGLSRPSTYSAASNYVVGWAHGRHNGRINVGWTDGHAKSMNVTYPGNTDAIVQTNRKAEVGFLVKPGCPLGSACQNFYYDPAVQNLQP